MPKRIYRFLAILLSSCLVLQSGAQALTESTPHQANPAALLSQRLPVDALAMAPLAHHSWLEYIHNFGSLLKQHVPTFVFHHTPATLADLSISAIASFHSSGIEIYAFWSAAAVAVLQAIVPSQGAFLPIHVESVDPETPHMISIRVIGDQPGVIRALVNQVHKQEGNIAPGSRADPTEEGSRVTLLLEDIDRESILRIRENIARLKIPIVRRKKAVRQARFSISVIMQNEPGVFHAFLERLHARAPEMNIVRFSSSLSGDQDQGWIELNEIAVPAESERYGQDGPEQYLFDVLAEMSRGDFPLVGDFEVTPLEASRATLAGFDRILDKATGSSIFQRVWGLLPSARQMFGLNGRADPDEIRSFKDAFTIAQTEHAHEQRIRRGHPAYITHPVAVYSWLRKWSITDPTTLKIGILHDVTEKLTGSALAQMKDRMQHIFSGSKHRFMTMLEYISDYTNGRYDLYAKQLTVQGEINLLAVKLADMIENLSDIFDIDLVENPDFNPYRQFAKRLRFGLPIVTWEPRLKNGVYRESRRDFLNVLIAQSERIPDEQFFRLYTVESEDRDTARAELIININHFLAWADRNTDSLPTDTDHDYVGQERIERFRNRLVELRIRLMNDQLSPDPRISSEARNREMARLFPSFKRFMDIANETHYEHHASLGDQGHFTTMPIDLSPFYGQMIAEQAFRIWRHMKEHGTIPDSTPFEIWELGGGTGALARDILSHIAQQARINQDSRWNEFWHQVHYTITEQSSMLRSQQLQLNLPYMQDNKLTISLNDARQDLRARGSSPITGIILGNELLDDFGSHKVRIDQNGHIEVALVIPTIPRKAFNRLDSQGASPKFTSLAHDQDRLARQVLSQDVTAEAGDVIFLTEKSLMEYIQLLNFSSLEHRLRLTRLLQFKEIYMPAFAYPEIIDHFHQNAETYATALAAGEGDDSALTVYVNSDADMFFTDAAKAIQEGFLLMMDYGHSSGILVQQSRYGQPQFHIYGPDQRFPGTDGDPYDKFSEYNFTINLNFTALAQASETAGWHLTWYGMIRDLMEGTSFTPEGVRQNMRLNEYSSSAMRTLRDFLDERNDTGIFKMLLLQKHSHRTPFQYSPRQSWPPIRPARSELDATQTGRANFIHEMLHTLPKEVAALGNNDNTGLPLFGISLFTIKTYLEMTSNPELHAFTGSILPIVLLGWAAFVAARWTIFAAFTRNHPPRSDLMIGRAA